MSRIPLVLFSFLLYSAISQALYAGSGSLRDFTEPEPIHVCYSDATVDGKLFAPVINLTAIPFQMRMAQLSWTTDDPALQGSFYVERDVANSGIWEVLKQLPYNATLQYIDTINAPYCNDTNFQYRIRFVATLSGEITYSNTSADLVLKDDTKPANVSDLLVSLVFSGTGNFPILTWNQVPESNIKFYEVDRYDGSGWPFLTNLPPDSNSYIDKTVNDACVNSYSYEIVTIDLCDNRSTPAYFPLKQTIQLDFPQIDECERLAKLSWNNFNSMPDGLAGYRIFRRINGVGLSEIANLTDTTATSYTDAYQFIDGSYYTYYVEAYNKTGTMTSVSCQKGWVYAGFNLPDSIYITSVSVVDDDYVKISFHSSPENTVKKLILERSTDGIIFQEIDSLYYLSDFVPQDGYLNDTTADVHSQSYYYRLVALDYCETTRIYSNISRTIFVQCSSTQTQNTADWNAYESWMQGVEGYKVYRTVNGLPQPPELMGNFSSTTYSYPDLLAGIDPTKQVCYSVEGIEKPGNPYLSNAVSLSNTCCIIKGATVFMPNAFHPGGLNNRFRPVATFVDPQSFKMTIFSRWGQQIFETTDMVNGWNGLVGDQIVPPGLYAYIITYSSVGGQDYTKRGTVFVVR